MARAFDLVHKISKDESADHRIPFEDSSPEEPGEPPKPKRPKVEMTFFFILLFVIFFVMGSTLLSPDFLDSIIPGKKTATASPSPKNTPNAGFAIEKNGQSVDQAAKDLGVTTSPSPTIAASAATTPSPATSPSTAETPTTAASTTPNKKARIQVLNGTTVEGAAAAMRTKLANAGIVVESIGNYKSKTVAKTTVFYRPDYKTAAQQVQGVTGGILSDTESGIGSYDILVVIGKSK